MAPRIRMFYAYPSKPPTIGEVVLAASQQLKGSAGIPSNVQIKRWPDVPIAGKNLSQTIVNAIQHSQIFACDLTYPNNNVSFELGYAIGRFKRIFVSVDTSIKDSERRFRNSYFNLLSLGYAPYQNEIELAMALTAEHPWSDLKSTILGDRHRQQLARPELPTLLYVKPPIDTPSVLRTVESLQTSVFGESLIIDNPSDNPAPVADWYAEQLKAADAVIVHLMSSEQIGSETHNTKASIVAGLAHGLDRQLLMLAHAPFESPVDYGYLLRVHETAEACAQRASAWLLEIGKNLPQRRARRPPSAPRATLELRHVALGQPVAEHERDDLDNYFVETSPYYRAMEGPTTILLGRRGTGKTAILHAIRANLERSLRNHVTILDPVGYEIEGLVRLLEEIRHVSERGFLIGSLWKYLIYSEIALSLEKSIVDRPLYRPRTDAESEFLSYCEANDQVIRAPFSMRLDNAVRSLSGLGSITNAVQQRTRISEQLHDGMLRDLRMHIGAVLIDSDRLAILIDNLDGPWAPGAHVAELSELIGGLLGAVQDIPREFGRSGHGLQPINTRVTVLLRSDIFSFVQPLINEQDKLPIERIVWDVRDLLLQVLDLRLLRNAPTNCTAHDVWEQLFPAEVVGVSPIDFVFRSTLPRPRDVIYMVREAVNNAINRRHAVVSPQDLLDARDRYSEFVFRSILAEDDPRRGRLETVLYEFAGLGKTVTMPEIRQRMLRVDVDGIDAEWYVDLLCDVGFFGISTRNGFRYSRDESERSMLREIAGRLAAQAGEVERFEINPAFYHVLQIE